ncbi:MAG: phosphoglucosamine mutase [Eubacteriaceae bacterium]|jgi:phosphoglucosamine mutase|nr:phosphoglucosamine mutase [Eubacteriaceae bacterium]
MQAKFGTDGVRGKANVELTAGLALRIARAACQVLGKGEAGSKAVIARDTRASGSMFECALAAGMMSRGFDAVLCGVMPTPSIGVLVQKYKSSFGAMVSASHNPYQDNGIKLFSREGAKLADSVESAIVEAMASDTETGGSEIGQIIEGAGAKEAYIGHLEKIFGDVRLNGMRFVLDCANGAASGLAEEVFCKLGASVHAIASSPNGININDGCGSTHPSLMRKAVLRENADAGLAFDGDSDRLVAAQSNGSLVDGDALLFIFGSFLSERGRLSKNTVVATVMSNSGLALSLREKGIATETSNVGDRYVLESMLRHGLSLGGEQSGHIINFSVSPTGDGIASGLFLSQIMAETGKSLSELLEGLTLFPQSTENALVALEKKDAVLSDREVAEAVGALRAKYEGRGKVLVRPSGTEPKVRVTIEGEAESSVASDAKALSALIERRAELM